MLILSYFVCISCSGRLLSAHRGGLAGNIKRITASVPASTSQKNMCLIRKHELHTSNQINNVKHTTNDVNTDPQTNERPENLSPKLSIPSLNTNQVAIRSTYYYRYKWEKTKSEKNVQSVCTTSTEKILYKFNNIGNIYQTSVLYNDKGFKFTRVGLDPSDGILKTIRRKMNKIFNGDEYMNPKLTTMEKVDKLLSDGYLDSENQLQMESEALDKRRLNNFRDKIISIRSMENLYSPQGDSTFKLSYKYISIKRLIELSTDFFNVHMSGLNKNKELDTDKFYNDDEEYIVTKMMVVKNIMEQEELNDAFENLKQGINLALDNNIRIGMFVWNYHVNDRFVKDKELVVDITKLLLNFRRIVEILPNQEKEVVRIVEHIEMLKAILAEYIEYKDEGEERKVIFTCEKMGEIEEVIHNLIEHEEKNKESNPLSGENE